MGFVNKLTRLFKETAISNILDYNLIGLDEKVNDQLRSEEMELYIHNCRQYIAMTEQLIMEEYSNSNMRIVIINDILDKLAELTDLAIANKLFKADYQNLKHLMIHLLTKLFGNSSDIDNMKYTVTRLENMGMIPKGSLREFMKMCPVGHWL